MKGKTACRIYLIRHGETTNAGEICFNGHFDVDLSDQGKNQSQHIADALKECSYEVIYFDSKPSEYKSSNEKEYLADIVSSEDMNDAFECACVQHEIDHLDGITMFERSITTQPYSAPEKIGRNEKVMITDGKETKELKWKKAQPLVESGDWEMTPA